MKTARNAVPVALVASPLLLVVIAACAMGFSSAERMYAMSPAQAPMEEGSLPPGMNTESYSRIDENPFLSVATNPLSTFGADVDTASYSNVRRFLTQGQLPPADAVRIEELVNYFPYGYAAPAWCPPGQGCDPFAVYAEVGACPWSPDHRLVRLGIKAAEPPRGQRPPANLVFLLDVSGSMADPNKLPLLKSGLKLLAEQMTGNDRVSIVVYAGAAGLVLPPTSGADVQAIVGALERLEAGGSTAGGAGIELAYATAEANLVPGGINRVILATDGDFNVGTSSEGELTRLIEEKAKTGVFLTVLGFGMGNYKDSMLEKLADRGNGNYAYVDSMLEARKVLVEQVQGTLHTVAKDVKLQLEFNPSKVSAYRLIGYENRLLRAEDFKDDAKDAGDVGAGHTVTALYEVVPAGVQVELPAVDPLRYQAPAATVASSELFTMKIRYKEPDGSTSKQLAFPVEDATAAIDQASPDFRFASAVAEFGMLLRGSQHKGKASWEEVVSLAQQSVGTDPGGYRREFMELAKRAGELQR